MAVSSGWSITTAPGARSKFVAFAKREGSETVSIAHDDLEAALGKLFRVILPRPDARSSYDEAHGREITVEAAR
jgi:hypothetical protein